MDEFLARLAAGRDALSSPQDEDEDDDDDDDDDDAEDEDEDDALVYVLVLMLELELVQGKRFLRLAKVTAVST